MLARLWMIILVNVILPLDQLQRTIAKFARQFRVATALQAFDQKIIDVHPRRAAPHLRRIILGVIAGNGGNRVTRPELAFIGQMRYQTRGNLRRHPSGNQREETERCADIDPQTALHSRKQPGLRVPSKIDHPPRLFVGATRPLFGIRFEAKHARDFREGFLLHAQVGIQVRRFDRHTVIP